MKHLYLYLSLIFSISVMNGSAQEIAQFRGPHRDGVFPETGLLRTWPAGGPNRLWVSEGLGGGYASVSVTDDAVYATGRDGAEEVLTVLSLDGDVLWRLPYGRTARRSWSDSRCTPAVEGDRIYCISGSGDVVCIDGRERTIRWSVPAFEKFRGECWEWEIAEQPLIVDDKIVFTPGGHSTSMVALDKNSGETVWQTESLHDTVAMASPNLIEFGGRKIVVNVMINYVFGVDADSGEILWSVRYSEIEPPTDHPWKPHNNCVMPLYHDGQLYVTSGYDHVGVMFRLLDGGRSIEPMWIDRTLDNHHGQVVRVGDHIYGANWLNNRAGHWCCVDWRTGETLYEAEWHTKGSISVADGMLYCYEERGGNLALAEATPEGYRVAGSFQITMGQGPHWSQPVIRDGVLYIRHGDALMAYDVGRRRGAETLSD